MMKLCPMWVGEAGGGDLIGVLEKQKCFFGIAVGHEKLAQLKVGLEAVGIQLLRFSERGFRGCIRNRRLRTARLLRAE